MRERVTDPEWVYYWIIQLGDMDAMIDRIIDTEWARKLSSEAL